MVKHSEFLVLSANLKGLWRFIGCMGGADRTFACKSQECLWQDWYILVLMMQWICKRGSKVREINKAIVIKDE